MCREPWRSPWRSWQHGPRRVGPPAVPWLSLRSKARSVPAASSRRLLRQAIADSDGNQTPHPAFASDAPRIAEKVFPNPRTRATGMQGQYTGESPGDRAGAILSTRREVRGSLWADRSSVSPLPRRAPPSRHRIQACRVAAAHRPARRPSNAASPLAARQRSGKRRTIAKHRQAIGEPIWASGRGASS